MSVYTDSKEPQGEPEMLTLTTREFRAHLRALLQKAARMGRPLRVGNYVLSVQKLKNSPAARPTLYGIMQKQGRVLGSPASLLRTDDVWDGDA